MYAVEKGEAKVFEFAVDGREYAVPCYDDLPMPVFRKLRARLRNAENPTEECFDALFDLFDEYAPGAIDSLAFSEATKLVNAYVANNGGASLGESSTSSD